MSDLQAEVDRLRRVLERIAQYPCPDGYRAAYYSIRWHARTALTGELSPTRTRRPDTTRPEAPAEAWRGDR
jgi:hypothetical protein